MLDIYPLPWKVKTNGNDFLIVIRCANNTVVDWTTRKEIFNHLKHMVRQLNKRRFLYQDQEGRYYYPFCENEVYFTVRGNYFYPAENLKRVYSSI